jgi:hypothetical protein
LLGVRTRPLLFPLFPKGDSCDCACACCWRTSELEPVLETLCLVLDPAIVLPDVPKLGVFGAGRELELGVLGLDWDPPGVGLLKNPSKVV